MSPAKRLVANALQSLGDDATEVPKGQHIREYILNGVLGRYKAYEAVMKGYLAFASSALRRTLVLHYEPETWEGMAVRLRDALPSDEIGKLDFRKINAIIASLRLDEARAAIRQIELDESGQPYLDRSQLPKIPSPDIPATEHEYLSPSMAARQGCPALYIIGSLPFAEKALAEIVRRAQVRYGY